MKSTTRKIKEAFENATPNVLGSILTDCGAKDSQPLSVVPTKKPSRFLNFAASAAALLLLAGIGAGIASLVIAGRTQYATTQTEETTAPTTDEDLKQLNNDIIRAFCELTDNDYTKIGSKLSVRHYWNADGSYIFFVDGLQDYPNEITYFSLLSKEFLFPTTQIFHTYKDGYCYEAEHSLYQTAFISHEQFLEFYEYHKLQNADLYDPTNWPARSALDCPAHLTSEKRAELEKALGIDTYYDTDRFWDSYRYYGTYDGYDILLQEHKELFGTHITDIAGQAFACPYWYTIFAHKDGIKIDLNEAYEQGLVSRESVKAAYAWNYQAYGDFSAVCCPYPTYIYIQKRIEEAWQKISDVPFGTWYSEDNPNGDWRFYSPDILFYCGGEQEERITCVKIGDSLFVHPTTFQLYYFDHETLAFIPLDEAYGEIVTKDSVADAALLHAQCQEFVFGEDWSSDYQSPEQDGTVSQKLAIEMGISIVQQDTNLERNDIILKNRQLINDPLGDYYRLTLLSDVSVYTIDIRINSGELLNVAISKRVVDPAEVAALEIAEKQIQLYRLHRDIGICCDFEDAGYEDMSRFLTSAQKENYCNYQYRILCCHTAEEVKAHIDRIVSEEVNRGYPDDQLFTDDEGNLYIIVLPTEYEGYYNIQVLEYSETHIVATAEILDYYTDRAWAVETFTFRLVDGNFIIESIEREIL